VHNEHCSLVLTDEQRQLTRLPEVIDGRPIIIITQQHALRSSAAKRPSLPSRLIRTCCAMLPAASLWRTRATARGEVRYAFSRTIEALTMHRVREPSFTSIPKYVLPTSLTPPINAAAYRMTARSSFVWEPAPCVVFD
jgi:hypothetical protein